MLGCRHSSLTVVNESSAWLRVTGPQTLLANDPAPFGLPPGSSIRRPDWIETERLRPGPPAELRIEASDADRAQQTFWILRLEPPGPFRLRVRGGPDRLVFERINASGRVLPSDGLVATPDPLGLLR
ncbi:MAG: hypothetical protein AAFX79_04165 [Planctomycetota bacterium]